MKVYSYEDKESLKKRINFYKSISKYSNNTIQVGVSHEKGLSCVANDYIEYGSKVLRIPTKLSLNPYSLFPFKYEFIEMLMEIPGMKNTIEKEHKFSVYILTYYLLYFMYAPKDEIKKYIIEKNLKEYLNIEDPDESLRDSFPKITLNTATLNDDHYSLLNQLGYPIDKGQELIGVFRWMNQKVYSSEHMEMIFPWISKFHQFKWAYSIVMSRGMTLRMSEYYILEKITNLNRLDQYARKNMEANRSFSSPHIGATCIVGFVDLCNHHQPKFVDIRDKRPIVLDAEPGYFVNTAATSYKIGDEITYTYVNDPSNGILFLHYGFVIPYNIFNVVKIKADDDKNLSLAKFNLCKELECLDPTIRDANNVPKNKIFPVRIIQLNTKLINFARVKFLDENFNHKLTLKNILNDIPISFENEISAWLYYYNSIKNTIKEENLNLLKSLKKAQKYRNICRLIESDWKDDEFQREEWLYNKSFENIYALDISYKNIFTSHMNGSIKKVIFNTQKQLDSLKTKYLP